MQEIYSIENDVLSVKIKAQGAELCSIKHKENGREFLWQADEIWPRHAPILFPNVGSLLDHEYHFEGQSYNMKHHGFARDSRFDALHQSEHSIAFVLTHNRDSLVVFPFAFSLIIRYRLDGNRLEQSFRLINEDQRDIYASFGGHPAFSLKDISEYRIQFEHEESVKSMRLHGPYIAQDEIEIIQGNSITLNKDIFKQDALIFKGLKSNWLSLEHLHSSHSVKFNFADWPYLAIWSKPGAAFVCIEPWQGLADRLDHNKEWIEKEGVVKVEAEGQISKAFNMQFSI